MVSPFVTGLLGWWIGGGPVGALIGAGLGILWNRIAAANQQQQEWEHRRSSEHGQSFYHSSSQGARSTSGGASGTGRRSSQTRANPADPADFAVSFMVLVAAVMKADGRATRDELDVVKRYLSDHYPDAIARDALHALRDLLKEDIDVKPVCARIAVRFDAAARRQLLHMLFTVALADGTLMPNELVLLLEIGTRLRLSKSDILSIAAMFGIRPDASSSSGGGFHSRTRPPPRRPREPTLDDDYAVLGIPASATDDDLKKAYRRMALKHHPDKVAHLGPAAQADATRKFQTIQAAYDRIRAARHLS